MTKPHDTQLPSWRHLGQESALIILCSYVLLVGGGFGGLVVTPLCLVSTALLALGAGLRFTARAAKAGCPVGH